MRRALLLVAVIALPGAALPQVPAQPGQVVEIDNFDSDPQVLSSYINTAQCAGTEPVRLEWSVRLVSGEAFTTTGTYRIFASDQEPTAPTTGEGLFCAEQDDQNGHFAGPVASPTADTTPTQQGDVSGADIVRVSHVPGSTPCALANERKAIWVCAHYFDSGSQRIAFATGKFIIQVRKPNAPASVSTTPGEGALNVSWPAAEVAGDAAEARSYRVVVLRDGTEVRRIDDTTAREVRVSGLENDVTYEVRVFGLSVAKNPSDAFASTTGTPKPVEDFWESYRGAGGREEGGCGTGGAGPLALLAVAGLLAVRRRM